MKKISIRYAVFAVFVFVTVAGPGPPMPKLPVPRGVRPPRGVGCGGPVPRGVGCGGGARVAPILPPVSKVVAQPPSKVFPIRPGDPRVPLPSLPSDQRAVLLVRVAAARYGPWLRDLKIPEEISATPPPTSLVGDLPLPELGPIGPNASVREAPGKDLPPLVKEPRARYGAQRAIEAIADTHRRYIPFIPLNSLPFRGHPPALHPPQPPPLRMASAREPDDREDKVERQLGRPLTPEERLLARRLLRTRRPAEVAAVLRSMEQK